MNFKFWTAASFAILCSANVASASLLVCSSQNQDHDNNYVLTVSSDRKTAHVFHPKVGERSEMNCETNKTGMTCNDEQLGLDMITSTELRPHPVSKQLTGSLVRFAPFNHRTLPLADLTCIEK